MPHQTRRSFTASFKLSVCEKAEIMGNRAAGRQFKVDESQVRKWKAQRAKLEEVPSHKKALRGGAAKWPELEERLIVWIAEELQQGCSVSNRALRRKAKEIADSAGIQGFTASSSWTVGFRSRHRISMSNHNVDLHVPEHLEEETLTVLRSIFKEEIVDEEFEGF